MEKAMEKIDISEKIMRKKVFTLTTWLHKNGAVKYRRPYKINIRREYR